MTEQPAKFFIRRVKARQYVCRHLRTKRRFELRRASQTNQQWSAYEMTDKGLSKNHFVTSRKSQKDLLDQIDKRIEAQEREAHLQWLKDNPPPPPPSFQRIKPFKYAALKKKELAPDKILYQSESGEKFLMVQKKDGWYCENTSLKGKKGYVYQDIASGMPSKDAALLELYYYLDTPEEEMSSEDWITYRKECFKERPRVTK